MGWILASAFTGISGLSFFAAWAASTALNKLDRSGRLIRNDGEQSSVQRLLTAATTCSVISGMIALLAAALAGYGALKGWRSW